MSGWFPCHICSTTCSSFDDWTNHTKNKHDGNSIPCFKCTRVFKKLSHVIMHYEHGNCIGASREQIKHGVRTWEVNSGNRNLLTVPRIGWTDEKPSSVVPKLSAVGSVWDGDSYECPLCDRFFGNLNSLRQHLNSLAHGKETNRTYVVFDITDADQTYDCPMCTRSFRKLQHLNCHLNSAVHDPTDFQCRQCGTQFILLSALFMHFESDICGAMSASAVAGMASAATKFLKNINGYV